MKTLKCDDLTYLEDAKLFKDKIAFKLRDEDYTVKESYMEYKYEKEKIRISDSRCYGDNITDFEIVVDDTNLIGQYKGEGPVIFNYRKPPIRSNKWIINREAKSIGYKKSTGDIMNCTKTVDHIIFDKRTEGISRITKEFYKGNEKDGENPRLNMFVEVRFTDEDTNNVVFLHGVETRTSFDQDGNIEDMTTGLGTYAFMNTGELICVSMMYTFMSSEDDKRNVIPRLIEEMEDGEVPVYYVEFYQKEHPEIVLATEKFIANDENKELYIIESKVGNTVTTFNPVDGMSYTSEFTDSDGYKYQVRGKTGYPLSSDYFVFDEYKGIKSFSMISYFDNIYETEYNGDAFLNTTTLELVSITKDGKIDKLINYSSDCGHYFSQHLRINHGSNVDENLCYTNKLTLPNGNILKESVINADPLNPKSVFYEAVEYDKDDIMVSRYRALAVKHVIR